MNKVFTKYDKIPDCITVVHTEKVEYLELGEGCSSLSRTEWHPAKTTEGLEDVKFVEYTEL